MCSRYYVTWSQSFQISISDSLSLTIAIANGETCRDKFEIDFKMNEESKGPSNLKIVDNERTGYKSLIIHPR